MKVTFSVLLSMFIPLAQYSVEPILIAILDRESGWFDRGVKEAVYISGHHLYLNRDGACLQ